MKGLSQVGVFQSTLRHEIALKAILWERELADQFRNLLWEF